MSKDIILGLSMVNPLEHADISPYKTTAPENEPSIYVIEMATWRAKHLGDRLMVFTRLISEKEHQRRERAYAEDPDQYMKNHLESLGS